MKNKKSSYHEGDHYFAKCVCRALKSGAADAIVDVYERYHQRFYFFARKRLHLKPPWESYDNTVLSLVDDYWGGLIRKNPFCKYTGKASLYGYLAGVLKLRIITAKISIFKELNKQNQHITVYNQEDEQISEEESLSKLIAEQGKDVRNIPNPFELIISKQARKLFFQSLKQLEKEDPDDADLVIMYLNGMSFKQMAQAKLIGENTDDEIIRKTANAYKTKFNRRDTGSKTKFIIIFQSKMEQQEFEIKDLKDIQEKYGINFSMLLDSMPVT